MVASNVAALEAFRFPTTSLFASVCVGVWLHMYNSRIDLSRVSISYDVVFNRKEYWRIVSASISHVNIIHLAMNMLTFWNYRFLEARLTSLPYFLLICVAMLSSMGVFLMIKAWRVRFVQNNHAENESAVGFSAVLFALMAFSSFSAPAGSKTSLLGFVTLPATLSPFAALITTQILLPRASFVGHLSGIIAGYLIAIFSLFIPSTTFLSNYWLVCFTIG
mmetsp:Transcript_39338/g.100868  ORF Transcript_39338/g.100868 Transcript_39338/m.100868 type:complete len:220 (+) Transcript_39338:155-814(+)